MIPSYPLQNRKITPMTSWSPILPSLNSLFASSSTTVFQNKWQQLQANGVTKAELQQEAQTLQNQLGFVPPQLQQLLEQFDTADTNHDGKLSQTEFNKQIQANKTKNPFAASIAQQVNGGVSNPFGYTGYNNNFQLGQQGLTGISSLQNGSSNSNRQYSASADRLTNLIKQFGTIGSSNTDDDTDSGIGSSLLY
jgi:hypothetical protein